MEDTDMQHAFTRCSLLVLITAALLVCVPTTAEAQSASTPPPYPPPGKLVDMGGWRLHILDEPELVVTSIRNVVAATRK
jgi:hypothetical protein